MLKHFCHQTFLHILFLHISCATNEHIFNILEEGPIGEQQAIISDIKGLFSNLNLEQLNRKYYLFKSDSRANVFEVTQSTGILYVNKRVDREVLCQNAKFATCSIDFQIFIKENSLAKLIERVQVRVNVLDINDSPPSWSMGQIFQLQFVEGDAEAKMSIPLATDADFEQNAKIKYRLENQTGPFKLFHTSTNLILGLNLALDRENLANYTLNLIAVDGGAPSLAGTLILEITVLDINDNSPRFLQTNFTTNQPIPEDIIIGSHILKLEAIDDDMGANAQLSYAFGKSENLQHKLAQQYFKIHSNGQIEVIKNFDYDRMNPKFFAFEVNVEDNAPRPYGRTATTSVIVNVMDINDELPEIEICFYPNGCVADQKFSLSENVIAGYDVAELRVTDLDHDGRDNITCNLRDLDDTSSGSVEIKETKFVLHKRSSASSSNLPSIFEMKTVRLLDREQRAYEQVRIECSDQVGHISRKALHIHIEDVNDNRPIFYPSKPVLHIAENQMNLPVSLQPSVHAVDLDEGVNQEILYSIVNDVHGEFMIDAKSGLISAKRAFDREEKDRYFLQVIATDKGYPTQQSSTTTVTVLVLDQNDWAPTFNSFHENFSVEENLPNNTRVGQIIAHDKDEKMNSEVLYSIIANSNNESQTAFFNFHIDSLTGTITTQQRLDRESKRIYHFQVEAKDKGMPSLSSTVHVSILVKDTNDNAPVFKIPNYDHKEFILGSYESGHHIVKVVAEDIDENSSPITYSIVKGADNLFAIDSSGMLYLSTDLSKISTMKWDLQLQACDAGKPHSLCKRISIKVRRRHASVPDASNDFGLSVHKAPPKNTSPSLNDNQAVVLFLAIIFGILLITLLLALFMIQRRLIEQRETVTMMDCKNRRPNSRLCAENSEICASNHHQKHQQYIVEGETLLATTCFNATDKRTPLADEDGQGSKQVCHLYSAIPNCRKSNEVISFALSSEENGVNSTASHASYQALNDACEKCSLEDNCQTKTVASCVHEHGQYDVIFENKPSFSKTALNEAQCSCTKKSAASSNEFSVYMELKMSKRPILTQYSLALNPHCDNSLV